MVAKKFDLKVLCQRIDCNTVDSTVIMNIILIIKPFEMNFDERALGMYDVRVAVAMIAFTLVLSVLADTLSVLAVLTSAFAILATVTGELAVIDGPVVIATDFGHFNLINAILVDTSLAASENAVVPLLKQVAVVIPYNVLAVGPYMISTVVIYLNLTDSSTHQSIILRYRTPLHSYLFANNVPPNHIAIAVNQLHVKWCLDS